jgi:adenosylmethionine-8-amino-7-oxononanoate aminotransferase
MKTNESVEDYVARLAQELEDEFQRLGPDTVCAFIAETMTGAVSITYVCPVAYIN